VAIGVAVAALIVEYLNSNGIRMARSTVGTRNVMAASFAIFAQLKPSGDYHRTHGVA
jgi:hypothetical protein